VLSHRSVCLKRTKHDLTPDVQTDLTREQIKVLEQLMKEIKNG
jgi:hypothetical protein